MKIVKIRESTQVPFGLDITVKTWLDQEKIFRGQQWSWRNAKTGFPPGPKTLLYLERGYWLYHNGDYPKEWCPEVLNSYNKGSKMLDGLDAAN
jgi:hypothetical protein